MTARWNCGRNNWWEAYRVMKLSNNGDQYDLWRFNPSASGYRPNAVPSEVLSLHPRGPFVDVNVSIDGDPYRFALYADGACAGNGTPRARASVGVYGIPNAGYNLGSLLPLGIQQTKQSAEIHSAIAALQVAKAIIKERWISSPTIGLVFSRTPGNGLKLCRSSDDRMDS